MWVQQKPNGKYQFFERYEDEVTGLSKTVSVTMDRNTTATRKAAQTALAEKIRKAQAKAGEYDEMTLHELLEIYLARSGIRESTRMRDTALSHVLEPILDKNARINHLTAAYIRDKLKEAGKEGNQELIARIKALLRWGYRNDYVHDVTWLDKLQKDKARDRDLRHKYLELDELHRLLDGMQIIEWRNLTEFLALSGLRIGEAIDLKREDVERDQIHVHSTFGLLTKESGPTKTDCGTRDVVIMPELADCIRRIRSRAIVSKYLLTGPGGKVIQYPAYRKYLAEKSERILGRRIGPHALRHTYTSLMAASGIPLDVIARQLGHEDSRVTQAVYFHITKKLKERDAKMIRSVSLLLETAPEKALKMPSSG